MNATWKFLFLVLSLRFYMETLHGPLRAKEKLEITLRRCRQK